MGVLVYRYRVKVGGNAARRRAVLDQPDLLAQFQLAHRLGNDLVRIGLDIDERRAAAYSSFPSVAEIELQLAEKEQRVIACVEAAKAERKARRSRVISDHLVREMAEAKAAMNEVNKQLREAKAKVKPLVKPMMDALEEDRKAAIKSLYRPYCQEGMCLCCQECTGKDDDICAECGRPHRVEKLYWATYNAAVAGNRTALKLVSQKRGQGRPAQLRFHRWDTTGRIAVQLQRHPGGAVRSGAVLASPDSRWRNVLRLPETALGTNARSDTVGEIGWYIGKKGRMVHLPVKFHRSLPEDAEVLEAELVRKRIVSHTQMHLCLTVRVPDPEPPRGARVAVHFGWRRRPDGSIRVATWRSTAPLEIPARLADFVTSDGAGSYGEIIAPAKWSQTEQHCASLASIRERNHNAMRERVAAWLDNDLAEEVRRWRSPRHLVMLTQQWMQDPPEGDGAADLVASMEAWRKQDKHLWEWYANRTRRLIDHRGDVWRNIAAWIGEHAGEVVIDDTDLAAIRRKPDLTEDTLLASVAADKARSTAVSVAPGELRATIVQAAGRRQIAVSKLSAKYLSRLHAACGYIAEAGVKFAAAAVVTCAGCGRNYDQDHNATELLIRGADA